MNYSFRNKYFLLFLSSLLFWFIFSDKTYAAAVDLSIINSNTSNTPTGSTDAPFGGTIKYTLTIRNVATTNATGFSITDTLPAGITSATWTCATTGVANCGTGTGGGTGNVAITGASINNTTGTNNIVITITGTAPFSGTFPTPIFNTATVTKGVGDTEAILGNNTSMVVISVNYEDFGDAPDSYGTLFASNGARHTYDSRIRMGNFLDSNVDGIPSVNADGDDLAGAKDEDAFIISLPAIPATLSTTTTNYSVIVNIKNFTGLASNLIGWIDFNGDGIFDPTEASTPKTFAGSITSGNTALNWPLISPAPVAGLSYIRLRYTTDPITSADAKGLKSNGEVEDHKIQIVTGGKFSLTGKVFGDDNYSAAFDSGTESGIANVPIILQKIGPDCATRTVTDINGNYKFENLPPGNYEIIENGKNDTVNCGTTLYASPPIGYGNLNLIRKFVTISAGEIQNIDFAVSALGSLTSFDNVCPVNGFLSEKDPFTQLNAVDLLTNAKTPMGLVAKFEYNGIGFSTQDGYIYGITNNDTLLKNDLVRVDSNGYAVILGEVTGLPKGHYGGADFDPITKLFYVNDLNSSSIFAINTQTVAIDPTKTITIPSALAIADFAFNPTKDPADNVNYIYAVNNINTTIYKINPVTGTKVNLPVTGIDPTSVQFLAVFFDPDNNFYVEDPNTRLQRIKINNAQNTGSVTQILAAGPALLKADGARCSFSKIVPKAFDFYAPNTTSVLPGATVIYPHKMTATVAGSASLNINSSEGYLVTVFQDVNNNGLLDTGDTQITNLSSIPFVAPSAPTPSNPNSATEINILIKFQAPASVASTIVESTTLSTTFTPTNTIIEPVIITLVDVTNIAELKGGTLRLEKTVKTFLADGTTSYDATGKFAKPTYILEYTLTYTNISGSSLKNIKINDIVPPSTTFVSAGFNAPATGTFTGPTGAAKKLLWDFGAFVLPQNGTGSVTFRVSVD